MRPKDLLGGFVVVDGRSGSPAALRFDAPAAMRCNQFIPDRQLLTDSMRACLPTQVPFDDAVANFGRVALGVAGLSQGRLEVIDRLTRTRSTNRTGPDSSRSCPC